MTKYTALPYLLTVAYWFVRKYSPEKLISKKEWHILRPTAESSRLISKYYLSTFYNIFTHQNETAFPSVSDYLNGLLCYLNGNRSLPHDLHSPQCFRWSEWQSGSTHIAIARRAVIFTTRGNSIYTMVNSSDISINKKVLFTNLKDMLEPIMFILGMMTCFGSRDWNKLWCLDLRHERYVNQLENLFLKMGIQEEVTDIFADHQKDLWVITSKGVWDAQRHCYLRLQPTVHQNSLLDIIRQDHQVPSFLRYWRSHHIWYSKR